MLDKTALLNSMKGFLIETLPVLLPSLFFTACFRNNIKMKKILKIFHLGMTKYAVIQLVERKYFNQCLYIYSYEGIDYYLSLS